jgi:pilus assembly protein CpaF
MQSLLEAKKVLHERVVARIQLEQIDLDEDVSLETIVAQEIEEAFPLIDQKGSDELFESMMSDVSGYGLLDDYLSDPEINEIMINSSSKMFIDRKGKIEEITLDTTADELVRIVQKIASDVGARFDSASPIVDAWLEDGSRLHSVMAPIAPDGPYLTIRKFVERSLDLNQFSPSELQKEILTSAVKNSKNIVVAGGTSSGKTTLLNTLIHLIPARERIVSIEETAELNSSHEHFVRLVARSSNSEGAGAITMGDLVKASLRMRPDRIVVGEVRSGEALDLLQALNTGHDGSLCTVHANGPAEVVQRIATLALFSGAQIPFDALVTQVYFGVDLIVYVKRLDTGKRVIASISEIRREGGVREIVQIDSEDGEHVI